MRSSLASCSHNPHTWCPTTERTRGLAVQATTHQNFLITSAPSVPGGTRKANLYRSTMVGTSLSTRSYSLQPASAFQRRLLTLFLVRRWTDPEFPNSWLRLRHDEKKIVRILLREKGKEFFELMEDNRPGSENRFAHAMHDFRKLVQEDSQEEGRRMEPKTI